MLGMMNLVASGHGIVCGGGVSLVSRVDEVKGITAKDTCWWRSNGKNGAD